MKHITQWLEYNCYGTMKTTNERWLYLDKKWCVECPTLHWKAGIDLPTECYHSVSSVANMVSWNYRLIISIQIDAVYVFVMINCRWHGSCQMQCCLHYTIWWQHFTCRFVCKAHIAKSSLLIKLQIKLLKINAIDQIMCRSEQLLSSRDTQSVCTEWTMAHLR